MKLNARIVARALSRGHDVEMFGQPEGRLLLRRPELLERGRCDLEPNHLYVGRCEDLPQLAEVGPGVVLVMTDVSPRLRWFRERCCVIMVKGMPEVAGVFNEVQRCFLRYDLWEETLYNIVNDDASIQAMLEASTQVLDGTLEVIDAGFRLLATTSAEVDDWTDDSRDAPGVPMSDAQGNLNPAAVRDFLAEHEPMMAVAEPFIIEVAGVSTLNVNLLEGEEYLGCLSLISQDGGQCDQADTPVLAFLGALVRRAMHRLDIQAGPGRGNLRDWLRTLVRNGTLDALSLASLASERGSYVCVKSRPASRTARLPLTYVRNVIEAAIPNTVAFEHERSCVVAFVRLEGLAPEGERRRELDRRLEELTGVVGIRAGVSDHLLGLESARTYYLQASIALDNGVALDPGQAVYRFQDYALQEMLLNSVGELPVEAYYTPGMRQLFAHDASSPVSYVNTLEHLLANNMNVTHTAQELYVHRSTLIERLGRIREAMGDELDDPACRLRIQLALAARRADAHIRG